MCHWNVNLSNLKFLARDNLFKKVFYYVCQDLVLELRTFGDRRNWNGCRLEFHIQLLRQSQRDISKSENLFFPRAIELHPYHVVFDLLLAVNT